MVDFIHTVGIPQTTIGFGASRQLGRIAKDLGGTRLLLITEAFFVKNGVVDKLISYLEGEKIDCEIFDGCMPNAPRNIIESCAAKLKEGGFNLAVALGGGSTIDTTKLAVATASDGKKLNAYLGPNADTIGRPSISKIHIPTTAGSGSEWSGIAVFKDPDTGIKYSLASPYFLAQHVIIDPDLTLHLPATITAHTGIDALSHAIEAYTSIKATLISDMFAEKVIQIVPDNLRAAYASGHQNRYARYHMAVAASLSLTAATSTGGGGVLAHGMAYPFIDLAPKPISHGASVFILLPYVMEFQLITNLHKFAKIAELMGEDIGGMGLREKADRSVEALRTLAMDVGMPQKMSEYGIKEADIPKMADSFFELRKFHAENSCRIATREDVTRIYQKAL